MDKRQLKFRSVILCGSMVLVVAAALFSPAEKNSRDSFQEETAIETPAPETEEVQFMSTEEENGLLNLYEMMKNGELAKAAAFMENNQDMIKKLLHNTFGGRRYLLTEEGITDVIDGRGLVLTSSAVAFYGNFAGGVPEGVVTAMQSIVLEEPRYDYSIGNWTAGKMSGFGTTGYTYYAETGEGDGLKTEKSGNFVNDLLEGEVCYISIDNSGNSVTWRLLAEHGLTKIDERWEHDVTKNAYSLLSENDNSHIYIIEEVDLESEIWRNRIIW